MADFFAKQRRGEKFRVLLRLYAGWHSGKTRTP